MLTRDEKACSHCSICSRICPVGAIHAFAQGDPEPSGCVQCGQCEAYCPKGAIRLEASDLVPYTNAMDREAITPERMGFHMVNRRSIRNFKKEQVDKALMERLMEVVRFAPTASNAQPVEWLIIRDTERLKRVLDTAASWMRGYIASTPDSPWQGMFSWVVDSWLNGKDAIFRGAPHLAIAHGASAVGTIVTDAVIATTYMEIAAPSFGIGTCWGGIFMIAASMSGELRRELGIPEGHTVAAALMLGYPELRARNVPKRQALKARWV